MLQINYRKEAIKRLIIKSPIRIVNNIFDDKHGEEVSIYYFKCGKTLTVFSNYSVLSHYTKDNPEKIKALNYYSVFRINWEPIPGELHIYFKECILTISNRLNNTLYSTLNLNYNP